MNCYRLLFAPGLSPIPTLRKKSPKTVAETAKPQAG